MTPSFSLTAGMKIVRGSAELCKSLSLLLGIRVTATLQVSDHPNIAGWFVNEAGNKSEMTKWRSINENVIQIEELKIIEKL